MPQAPSRPLNTPRAVRLTLALSLLALAALQAWRPFFFLTDDNLCGWTPVVVDLGRSIAHGDSPFVSPHLYGGAHDLARDPANLCLWNPLVLALAMLGQTPARFALADLYSSLNLLLCAFAMAHLLCRLREMQSEPKTALEASGAPQVLEAMPPEQRLSDARIVLLSLSFTFSTYALVAGASWTTFLANQASLPVMLLGLLHPRRRAGVLLVAGGVLHGLLGGHMSPLIFSIFFGSVFVAACSWPELRQQREPGSRLKFEMARRWVLGGALALGLSSPLLVPAARGFVGTSRSGSQSADFTSYLSVPAPELVASFFAGKLAVRFENNTPGAIPSVLAPIACCLGAWAALHSWGARRRAGILERSALGVVLLAIVFIARPPWLTLALSHVPILRSLRIPMREVMQFLFYAHLWIALRPASLAPRLQRASLAVGAALFLASLANMGPPSFSDMELDRGLVLSGAAGRHWDALRARVKGKRYVSAIEVPIPLLNANLGRVPWSLLGAYNYAALFGVPSRAGYYVPGLIQSEPGAHPLNAVMGIYDLRSAQRLQARHPEVVILSLASLDPPRIDWIERGQRSRLALPPLPSRGPLRRPRP